MDMTTLTGRVAVVERAAADLGLELGTLSVCGEEVDVHLRGERSTVAEGEQLCYALDVEAWEVKYRHAEGIPDFATVEGRVSPTLTVRVYCHETEPQK